MPSKHFPHYATRIKKHYKNNRRICRCDVIIDILCKSIKRKDLSHGNNSTVFPGHQPCGVATGAIGTFWAIVPPIVAIALALITKEVYISLFVGVAVGALLYNPAKIFETIFGIMGDSIGGNVNIRIFLGFLGIIVALVTKSGASKAYGNWAARAIKSKRGALYATSGLGVLIFVDDYFNCLTVGTVMSPVTDRHKISRAKLAYIIDANGGSRMYNRTHFKLGGGGKFFSSRWHGR